MPYKDKKKQAEYLKKYRTPYMRKYRKQKKKEKEQAMTTFLRMTFKELTKASPQLHDLAAYLGVDLEKLKKAKQPKKRRKSSAT